MSENHALVTVVTPFFNTERFLAECIESVLAQTYPRWEYVLVNNRSTDGSLGIAERYAHADERVRVVTNATFLAQDANYSEALRHASPESRYCKIVQADDWIFPQCIDELVAVAEENPSVGIVSSYWLKGTQVLGSGLPYGTRFLTGREVCRLQLQRSYFFFGSPTAVLLRTEMVRQTTPYYQPSRYHADTEACYRDLQRWDFGFVHQVLSFLRVADDSRTAAARDYYPHFLDKLIIVRRYGRAYLNEEEHRIVLGRVRDAYLRLLGDAVLTRRDPAFWEYHRQGLATVQMRLGWRLLWPYVLRAVAELVLNPKKTAGRILAWLRTRQRP